MCDNFQKKCSACCTQKYVVVGGWAGLDALWWGRYGFLFFPLECLVYVACSFFASRFGGLNSECHFLFTQSNVVELSRVSALMTNILPKFSKIQWRLHNCGNTNEATTLLQQFIKKKFKLEFDRPTGTHFCIQEAASPGTSAFPFVEATTLRNEEIPDKHKTQNTASPAPSLCDAAHFFFLAVHPWYRSCTKVHCHERALYFNSTFFWAIVVKSVLKNPPNTQCSV